MKTCFKIDLGSSCGKVKPLHGVNNSPMVYNGIIPGFSEAGIPYMRTHDTSFAYGGTHFVDIPNIFPDFDADETLPESYDFTFTDAYLKSVVNSGTKIFYRLGVTIENSYRIKAYNIFPPKDYNKWARICEHVIRHYNEGWADGFNYGIEYWEIWNEPENPMMWKGTPEQYFELYSVAAKHLKRCFPDIKVGGYAGCGFYYVTGQNTTDFYKSFVTFFDDFLDYISAPETKAPLDFYSWHIYTEDPNLISEHAEYVRKKLDGKGFAGVEHFLNEWNRHESAIPETYEDMKNEKGASFVAQSFAVMQKSSIDKAMYYDATPTRSYCGLYTFPGKRLTKTYYSLFAFNRLYKLGDCAACEVDAENNTSILAARGDGAVAMLLTNYSDEERTVSAYLDGIDGSTELKCRIIDAEHTLEESESIRVSSLADITLKPYSVMLLESGD